MRGPAARFLGLALATASAPAALAAGAERYEDGIGFYQRNEFEKSFKSLRPLAEKGDARAQYMLGRHYQFGQGVKADRAEAYHWYKRAEARGHLEAKLFRQLLEKRWKLTPDEKALGERRFTEATSPKAKPEKPKAETAAREPEKPAVTAKPAAPPRPESARAETLEKSPPKPPEKPAIAAMKNTPTFTPPADRGASEETRAPAERSTAERSTTERAEANRAPARRRPQAEPGERDTDDGPSYRPNPPPAETRASIEPPQTDGPSDGAYPRADRPGYAPPGYPTYAQPSYAPPTYAPNYYAPSAPPTWRPQGYYPQPSYAPNWGYQPRGYVHPGWRGYANPGWRANASWGPYQGRRFRGY